jgi:TonB family protein
MIKATLLLCVARLVIPRLQSRSAAERHLLWAAVLGAAAVLPWLQAVLPVWQPQWAETLADVFPASLGYLEPWSGSRGSGVVVHATGIEDGGWAPLAAQAAWFTGPLLAVAALALRLINLSRIAASASPVADVRVVRVFQRIAAPAERERVVLLQSPSASIPMTWGTRPPKLMLPANAVEWSDERLGAVFAHELAHIARRDWAVHILAEAACAIYWFNPLFWIARNALRREADLAADNMVLNGGIDGRDYADHLVAIVRGLRGRTPGTVVAMARSSDLAGRVASLVGAAASRRPVSRAAARGVAAIALCACGPLAAFAMPRLAAYISVRTTALPSAVVTAASPADPVSTAVRTVRVAAPPSEASALSAPDVVEYTTPPLYSDEGRQQGIEGVVVIRAHVGADGRVGQARIVSGLGHGLDQNALVALRQWRFRPGTRDGVPAPMDADVEVEFSLRHEELNELIANDMATQVGPGVTPPKAVITVQPAPASHLRGRVVLDVVLLQDGRPKIVRILRSASPDLDERAVQAFEQWRFSPALRGSTPVKVRMTAEVHFGG